METLLRLMLVHYYQDSKRATNATITRALDKRIRVLADQTAGLSLLVTACRKEAEAAKRVTRTAKKKFRSPHMHHGNPHVDYKPCRDRRR